MRYLVISDVHSNYPALQTVLTNAAPFDAILFLGDLVGYGPNPNECVERLQEFPLTAIVGNHDWGVIGRADLYVFNRDARQALLWTQREIYADNRSFLTDLPTTVRIDDMMLAHGSPQEPIWEYLVDSYAATENFMAHDFQLAFVGHTHLPLIFEWEAQAEEAHLILPELETPIEIGDRRLIVNPGSVGQPRDGDPRASYVIVDTEAQTLAYHRVPYPVEITQERMRARGLPSRLIERLERGR
ncbi:MAG: metallophosphoesterase family protein [Anaerolineales bacterium]